MMPFSSIVITPSTILSRIALRRVWLSRNFSSAILRSVMSCQTPAMCVMLPSASLIKRSVSPNHL
ncbi:hypothetical protein THIOM_002768 [Candidatus Thiomargarita nelsonii]|uniref:Uncharacterized protein n=1 Tax=Candidatus Thiomargarita nelsonii TaxID=1003181 RepID=A0A176S076_9GAMM|nr:hypothetical protein THIOM_002768 [Candidatus Thiomargarita nelsonii]